LARTASKLGDFYGDRYREQDARDDRIAKLTTRLYWLTWALLLFTAGSVAVTVWAVERGS
jgi:hypothetical protein